MNPHRQRIILFFHDIFGPTQSYRLRYTLRRGKWSLTSWQLVGWQADHWKRVRSYGTQEMRWWSACGVPMTLPFDEREGLVPNTMHVTASDHYPRKHP
jgi:hypothetical protein